MRKRKIRGFLFLLFLPYILAYTHLGYPQNILLNSDYIGFIQQKINTNFIYPKEAQIKGWEGITKVRFTLTKNGYLKEVDIAQSSGYPLLDAMAILAVKDASPYPFPQGYYTEQELELIVPIEFVADKTSEPAPPQSFDIDKATPEISSYQNIQSNPLPSLPELPPPPTQSKQAVEKTATPTKKNIFARDEAKKEKIAKQKQERLEKAAAAKKTRQEKIEHAENPKAAPAFQQPTPDASDTTQYYDSQEQATDNRQQTTQSTPSDNTGELPYFLNLALKNHEPTKVAREEVELAQIKVAESKRGFFPGFKVQAYNTTGEVNKVDYEERELKTQIDQPIFYGGRLKDTFDQAKVNLEITRKNYDRLKLDVMHKTETAYYNLVATKINLKQKEELYAEAKSLLEKVEKLQKVEMVTALELASSRSWTEQLKFQVDSVKHELFMAELTFKQILNTTETPVVTTDILQAKYLDLNLNHCIKVAYENRPELNLGELLVKFNEYGQRIESAKVNAFTVDLTSSYGWYQGHFLTEPWAGANNWFGGVKVSKPWGANTINSSYNTEHKQPQFGQTAPTAASTLSGDINFFDNKKRLSDKKKSDIDLHRSESDFNETKKTIVFEVQDAFLNYQKALLQLHSEELTTKFRRNEVEVVKIRAQVGEASISNAIESLFSLSEAQSKYTQALANYNISLATLKKTTGYGLQI